MFSTGIKIRDYIPRSVRRLRHKILLRKYRRELQDICHVPSARHVFSKVYKEGIWGKSGNPSQRYCSGIGSHSPEIVDQYIKAIRMFLSAFNTKPNVVDLGCGDFAVGSKIRDLCASYTACDVVDYVINSNKEKFADQGVCFLELDIIEDELPNGEVAFLRQVLQHLSNSQILAIVQKLPAKYNYVVVTERFPMSCSFMPNLDKEIGPDIRAYYNSGVVLTSPPFNLKVLRDEVLCQVPFRGGIGVGGDLIRTNLYALP